jgi:Protein of unknown function (DUF1759)/Putative peptidase (DUF1758)
MLQAGYKLTQKSIDKAFETISNHDTIKKSDVNANLKLERISLEKFDGNYKNWKSFILTFFSLVENSNLPKIQKFHYLKNHLEGEAKKIIQHLPLTEDNYSSALQLIKDRFENSRKIKNSYIETLLQAKQIQNRSAEQLIALHDLINECLQALVNLGCNINDWGDLLIPILSKKLDFESYKQFEEQLQNPKETPSINQFLKFLESRYQTLDSIKYNKTSSQKTGHYKEKSVTSYVSTTQTCPQCDRQHKLYMCNTFIPVKQRSEKVHREKLCVKCLSHERTIQCKSTYNCKECQGRHHTLLHDNEYKRKNSSANIANNMGTVLLSTACIKCKTITGDILLMRALIDSGAQNSMITENGAQLLKLPYQKSKLLINGIENKSGVSVKHKINVIISPHFSSNFETSVEAHILNKLTSNLPGKIQEDKLKWKNLMLADPTYNIPGPIDIILGADIYHDIIKYGVKKGKTNRYQYEIGMDPDGTNRNRIRQKKHNINGDNN